MKTMPWFNNSLSKHLLFYILLCSSFFTLLGTSLQLYEDYSKEISDIENGFHQIENVYLESISSSLWDMDFQQIRAILKGILNLPEMSYVEVFENSMDEKIIQLGKLPINDTIERIYQLRSPHNNQPIGKLFVVASKKKLYQRIKNKVFLILTTQMIKTLVVSFCILFIFQQLIMKHLIFITKYFGRMKVDQMQEDLKLSRNKRKSRDKDLFDILVDTINETRSKSKQYIEEIQHDKKIIRTSAKKFKTMIENLNDMIAILDQNGALTWISPAIKHFEMVETDIFEKKPINLVNSKSRKRTIRAFKNAIKNPTKTILLQNILITNKKGKKYNVDITIIYLPDTLGVNGMVLTASDITERISNELALRLAKDKLEFRVKERTIELQQSLESLTKTQKELIRSERLAALGNMVAGVAHEINTPLGIGVTESSFLVEKIDDLLDSMDADSLTRSDFEKFLKIISESAQSILKNLTRSGDLIRSFKQVAVDQTIVEERTFEIKNYIEGVLLSLRSEIKRTNHTIKVDCREGIMITSYPGALSQILTNLLINSFRHGFEAKMNGQINIRIKVEGGLLIFDYLDNGVGMDKSTLDQVFDPFFTTKRNQGGTGLGMNIVYNLATQKLNGDIKCISLPGKGVEFNIRIPIN